ncbi:unnamed protein product [Thlaspi arvense]|uniref:Leucine-rich repeat-containing N-terminal plant-type domain-containing protein n=1 Tax=Thlaspi arvense TaxID=13288 RepID=A0AAU9SFB9_THLAR|nr:unnamed protein product [Thlaspi arvense]
MKSMRLFLLLSFNALMLLEAYGFTDETDRQALIEFKSKVSEDKRVVLSSWNHSLPLCNWKGVTCGRKHKRVTRLDLGGLQLGGVISPSIGSLRPDFGNLLPNLQELSLGRNHLSGSIPVTLSNISTLQMKDSSKLWKGMEIAIPTSFCYSFGDLEFLDALTNCTHLHTLIVSENRLGGELPTSIVNLTTNLILLHLGTNHIYGYIPRDIGNLIGLQELGLEENLFTGWEAVKIGVVKGDTICYVSNNSFEGTIPPSLGNCRYLLRLYIGSNKLSGTIPQVVIQFPALVILSMGGNSFTGSLSKDVERLANIENVSEWSNFIYKEIGAIPDIKGLVGVKRVDFSNNNLSGSIPAYFAKFSSLEYLNLSNNNFQGRVATEGKFQNATIVFVFGNTDLCGARPMPCGSTASGKISFLSFTKKYGMGGAPSIHGDVFSFGLLLLEMFTGKRPINELFEGNFTLHSYTKSALPERVLDVADKSILQSGLRVGFPVGECLTLVLEVGLRCCDESPTNEAMKELISIREKFFKTRRTARS